MSVDFELGARLLADRLTVHTPPDEVVVAAEGIQLGRRQRRLGLPERMRRSEVYINVAVEKEVLGSQVDPAAGRDLRITEESAFRR